MRAGRDGQVACFMPPAPRALQGARRRKAEQRLAQPREHCNRAGAVAPPSLPIAGTIAGDVPCARKSATSVRTIRGRLWTPRLPMPTAARTQARKRRSPRASGKPMSCSPCAHKVRLVITGRKPIARMYRLFYIADAAKVQMQQNYTCSKSADAANGASPLRALYVIMD